MHSAASKAQHLSLALVVLGCKAAAPGGTLITQTELMSFLGFVGIYGDRIAVLNNAGGTYDLLIVQPSNYNLVLPRASWS